MYCIELKESHFECARLRVWGTTATFSFERPPSVQGMHMHDLFSPSNQIKASSPGIMTNIVYSKQPQANIHLAKGDSAQKPISLEYLAEGNANIIYAFKPTAEDAVPQNLHRKLLRLRKEKHFIEPTELQYQIYRRHLVPLFHPDNIVEQTLISLDKVLAASLNEDLKELEKSGSRKELRRGDRLATDEYGLLITGMTAQPGEFLFEIKPKWLQQSPDAPSGSVRCRTCALRLQRNNAEASGVVVPKSGGFCPLSLVDADIEERRRAFESIVRSQARTISEQAGKCQTMMQNTQAVDPFLFSPFGKAYHRIMY